MTSRLAGAGKQLGGTVKTACIESTRKVRSQVGSQVGQLRESAIEPLPHVGMPLPLLELDWLGQPDGAIDPGAVVRRLRGVGAAADRNALGCAYALLAWRLALDMYWLLAIAELRAAAGDPGIATRVEANLERVAAVSGLPIDP